MSDVHYSGACQCGAVRFECNAEPLFVSNCHCAACRKATGAAFSTWVGFSEDKCKWLSKSQRFYASSDGVRRGFCPACGTPMSYSGIKWPNETHFLIGVFDDPSSFTPRKNVFTDEALSWAKDGADVQ